MFAEAKVKHSGVDSKTKELEKLKLKISSLQNQIEATTERITELPKGIDAKVFYDQLLKLQDHKANFENQLQTQLSEVINQDQLIDFEDFQKFSEGLRQLAEKCSDPNVQAAIIRKLVAKIEVTPNSIVIHYNIGESHYRRELGAADPMPSHNPENKKGLVDLTRPFTKPLLKFSSDACSNTLKFGRETF